MGNKNSVDARFMDLRPGNHLCCLYQTGEEERLVLSSFLRERLELCEKVVCITDNCTGQEVLHILCEQGFDSDKYLSKKQLNMLSPEDAYLKGGFFNPDSMVKMLKEAIASAASEGYSSFAATGNASLVPGGGVDHKVLIEYEEDINRFVYSARCLLLCRYGMQEISSELLRGVLATHPLSVNVSGIYENSGYLPPGKKREYPLSLSTAGEFVELMIAGRRAVRWKPGGFDGELEGLLNGAGDVCILIGGGGTIENISVSGDRRCYGVEKKISGKKISEVLPAGIARSAMQTINAAANKNSLQRNEYELRIQGQSKWFEVRIAQLNGSGAAVLIADITGGKSAEAKLKEYESENRKQDALLKQKDAALRELLSHFESVKGEMQQNILANINQSIVPVLKKLKAREENARYVDIIYKALEELPSSFGAKIKEANINLTPTEIKICHLIRIGLNTKAMADLLNVSGATVEKHRTSIRKKFGLSSRGINLEARLKNF